MKIMSADLKMDNVLAIGLGVVIGKSGVILFIGPLVVTLIWASQRPS